LVLIVWRRVMVPDESSQMRTVASAAPETKRVLEDDGGRAAMQFMAAVCS
jgi:hypothetical protein